MVHVVVNDMLFVNYKIDIQETKVMKLKICLFSFSGLIWNGRNSFTQFPASQI